MLFNKKKAPAVQEPMDLDSVMKKFDRESNTRIWEGVPKILVSCALAIFALFCIYVTLFASWLEELRLTTFVAFIVFLGYLVYPAKKGVQKVNNLPWYDILLMLGGTVAFLYYAFNAKAIIQQGSIFEWYQIVIGIVGIISLVEVCRRSVGIPIVIVAGCFVAYALIWGLANPTLWGKTNYIVHYLFY
ncbi:MAG: TRAP transporter permease, partial [Clostridia bacterium]|nr:TRAP transporter permease [Clostridia bacterium]